MDKTAFISKITEIGTCEDEVQRRQLLTDLSEECEKDYDMLSELTEKNKNLVTDNESLRSANMKLFLQVGESKTRAEQLKDETGIEEKEPVKKRSLTEIFNN